ncbi:MAG: hypothetical protein IAE99_03975 [Rhodothermales bacterium]|nr:hypothetical protein [Rhodothermales bacterium]
MTPEEFERIKEQEKAHLRQIRDLKRQASDAGRMGRLASALEQMSGALTGGDATRAEFVDRLSRDAAHTEARMEIALEGQADAERLAEQAAAQARFEREQQEARARATLDALRAEMGGAPASSASTPSAASEASSSAAKTLGRTLLPDDPGPASPDGPPAKTLGRSA